MNILVFEYFGNYLFARETGFGKIFDVGQTLMPSLLLPSCICSVSCYCCCTITAAVVVAQSQRLTLLSPPHCTIVLKSITKRLCDALPQLENDSFEPGPAALTAFSSDSTMMIE